MESDAGRGTSRRLLILGYGRLGQAFHRKYHLRYEIRGVKRTPLPSDPFPLARAPIQSEAIVPHLHCAEEIFFCPTPGRNGSSDAEGDLTAYRDTYLGNILFLIDRLRREKITLQRFILISSTGIYPRLKEGPWPEDRPIPVESPRQEILLKTEEALIESGLPYVILRCGGLVGEGRDNFSHLQRRERFRTSEMTDDKIALVDQEDVCDLIDLAIQREIRNEIYNVVSDTPLLRRDLYAWVAWRYGIPIVDDGLPAALAVDRTIPNSKVKEGLGIRFRPFVF